ncbi:N-acyl-D-amino-acid deacylase family protein [Spirosoma aerophilum]
MRALLTLFLLLTGCNCLWAQSAKTTATSFDILIRNGLIYDGSGKPPQPGDVGIRGDRVVAVGKLAKANAITVIDAQGKAVAPGFINVLSHTGLELLHDGHSMSDLKQGITTEVFGELSWGPINTDAMRQQVNMNLKPYNLTSNWTTLAGFMDRLQQKGITPNIASYLGAGQVRESVLGEADVKPTPGQLRQMRAIVRKAMEEGALGITTALIYPPNSFATTDELVALCQEASRFGGRYIAHIRSEGDRLDEGVSELIKIGREAKLPVELYHFKASGQRNWPRMESAITLINKARQQGQDVTANMYTYTAGATGLTSCLPPYLFNGGFMAGWKRLQDPATRQKLMAEVRQSGNDWENMFQLAGSTDNILLTAFEVDSLKKYNGKTLGQMAAIWKKDPIETVMDLIVADKSRVETTYFLMSEENVRKGISQPWVSFGSDAASIAENRNDIGVVHPRTFGNFARLLGKYVRDEHVMPLEEAIRRLTSLPATNHKLPNRGLLQVGYFADLVIFDPAIIADKATFASPFQYAVGVQHVFVNGRQVLKDGEHTGVFPGRAIWGPGRKSRTP